MVCNNVVNNPCYETGDLRGIALTSLAKALVVSVYEGDGPGHIGQNDTMPRLLTEAFGASSANSVDDLPTFASHPKEALLASLAADAVSEKRWTLNQFVAA